MESSSPITQNSNFFETSVYYTAFVSVTVLSVYHQKEAVTFLCLKQQGDKVSHQEQLKTVVPFKLDME